MDERTSSSQHGFRAALVKELYTDMMGLYSLVFRYDLNALFSKAFRDFTVNVQGLSRVRYFRTHQFKSIVPRVLQGMFPLQAFYWGQKGARDNYSLQIRNIIDTGRKVLGEMPILIGECGVPMDMKYVFFHCSR